MRIWTIMMLLAAPGWAQTAHLAYEAAEELQTYLEFDEPEKIPGALDEAKLELLIDNRKRALPLAECASRNARRLTRAKPAETAAALEALGALAKGVDSRAPGEPMTLLIQGELQLALARMKTEVGEDDARPDYRLAADHLRAAYQADPTSPTGAARAVEVLHEMGEVAEVDMVELCEELDTFLEAAAERFVDSTLIKRVTAANCVHWARAVVAKKKGSARKLVSRAVDLLSGSLHGEETPTELATVYNDAIELDMLHGLGADGRTFAIAQDVAGHVTFGIPLSDRWLEAAERKKAALPSGDGLDKITASCDLIQLDWRWQPVRRLRVFEYAWGTDYIVGGQRAGGDNLKGLTHSNYAAALRSFKKVKKKKPVVVTVNPTIDRTWMYTIKGVVGASKVTRRSYFWRYQDQKRSYSVDVFDWSGDKGEHPVIAEILASFREAGDE